MTIPVLVRHMKHLLHNATWEEVAVVLGIDSKLLWSIRNVPGYRVSKRTRESILQSYKSRLQIPLPKWALCWRETLIELKARPGIGELRRFLDYSEGLLVLEPADPVGALIYSYMRMLVELTKALSHNKNSGWYDGPKNWKKFLRLAELQGVRGMILLNSLDADDTKLTDEEKAIVGWLRPIIFINWVQAIVEQQKLHYRRTRESVKKLLVDKQVIQVLKKALEANPYSWQLAYNGVELASFIEDAESAHWFYERLVELDVGFSSFDYCPGEVVAISKEPGMAFFRLRYAHLDKPLPSKGEKGE